MKLKKLLERLSRKLGLSREQAATATTNSGVNTHYAGTRVCAHCLVIHPVYAACPIGDRTVFYTRDGVNYRRTGNGPEIAQGEGETNSEFYAHAYRVGPYRN